MAIKTLVVDDMTGTEGAETITFGIDGEDYAIDLAKRNMATFRKVMSEYIEAGRKVTASKPSRRGRPPSPRANAGIVLEPVPSNGKPTRNRSPEAAEANKTKRDWMRANGWPKLGDRGRCPTEAEDAWAKHLQETGNGKPPGAVFVPPGASME